MRNRILVILICFFSVINVFASEINLSSEKYILYNMNEEYILDEKNSNVRTDIASLTKIMTVIVAIENIDDFDKKVKITEEMLEDIEWDVSVTGFEVGDLVTYDDLIYGAIISSGADACNALAISISGSLDEFIKLMNNKVKELKLENTNFKNVTGLYEKEHYSSAYDMSKILIYAIKNKKFREVFETKEYETTNNIKLKSTLVRYNSNKDIDYIKGSKTGYIKKAGYCLASIATLNDVDYLLITLNSYNGSKSHVEDAIKAYTYYDENYAYQNIVDKDDIVVELKTEYAKEDTIGIHANVELEEYLKKDFDKEDIEYKYKGRKVISYFTDKNTEIGTVDIVYNDKILDTFTLYYNEELSFSLWLLLWDYKWYIIGILFILFLLFCVKKNKRIKKRKKVHK